MINALKTFTELTDKSKLLSRLVGALKRKGNRLADIIDGGARRKQQAVQKVQQRQVWRKTARTQSQANAAEMQSDQQVLSKLEEMIAARIGRPVRHAKSEAMLKIGDDGSRPHLYRRAYTKHWFEVSGALGEKLMPLLDTDGLLGVFVKSATKDEVCQPLEFILSEQGGNGFRAPYFFGLVTVSDLKVAAWQAIDAKIVPFSNRSFEDQKRIIEAIAAANAVPAERTVPVLTRWVGFGPRKIKSKASFVNDTVDDQWKELYTRTADIMKLRRTLVRRLLSADARVLTHNDINRTNISVPPTGDVLLFDWEISTLSVPGADLRLLAHAPAVNELVSCYVSKMAQYGLELDTDAVRFTLDVIEGFRSLSSGWGRQSAQMVESGLTLLTRHLDNKGMRGK